MRYVLLLSAIAASMAATSQAAPQPGSHAARHGCEHQHPSKDSYKATTRLLKNHRPLSPQLKKRVRSWRTCVATAAKARAVHKHVRRLRVWRMSYAHRWPIVFNRLPAAWQNWAVATSSCEAHMNPSTNTGNGFFGAFQFMQSTWQMAGGTGNPAQHSWHYQAVIAVSWRKRSSQSQWPNGVLW